MELQSAQKKKLSSIELWTADKMDPDLMVFTLDSAHTANLEQ